MTTIDTLEVYYKPEDSSVYYVATTKTGMKSLVMTNHYTSVNLNITNIYPKKEAHLSLFLYVLF